MLRLLCLLLALALAAPAAGQVRIEITGGAEGALPIAVVPFQVGAGAVPPTTDMAGIIRADLYRSGLFDPLDPENHLGQPSRFEDVRFQNWRALGADSLVVGRIEGGAEGRYTVRYELLDVYGGDRLEGKRFRVNADALRPLAHTISDEIFQRLIGRPGGFNTRIAYVQVEGSGDEQQHKLVIAQADGHGPQTILTSGRPILSPDWSPDGERIAYVSFESGRDQRIFVQTVASGAREVVADYPGLNGAPAWSPDGERLAVTLSKDGNPDIYILTPGSDRQPRRVTRHFGIDTEPAWSPDGEHLYFTSDRGGSPQVYRVAADGGEAERVTFQGSYNASPDLSTDGRLMTFVHRQDGNFRIAVMDLERELMRVLTEGSLDESPSFSASGTMIAYTRATGGDSELATVSVYGRAQGELTDFPAEVREPDWSPLPQ
ncbi:Tol-Pal system protein TolB [Spiribacter halobius]|uniref:Tol-Pal system protein TolB n=2 Tax=Sediminicurvatus halobius TaxID=2182432 RepID=A0A2U2MWG8_9GAMM|nr:Tol-Pal system protein TolB [Spiribacter halobius]